MMRFHYRPGIRWLPALALVLMVTPAAHQGLTARQRAEPIDPSWMSFDSGARTVRFKLTAGLTGLNGALNFNGFRDGGLTLVVPVGWTVAVEFYNHDGMLAHSAQVAPNVNPVPLRAVDQAAIARAYSDRVEEGLPPESRDKLRFTAQPAGDYLVICGVPGHAAAGMWIRLRVSGEAEEPVLMATPKGESH